VSGDADGDGWDRAPGSDERLAQFLDVTGLRPGLDDPLQAALTSYLALTAAGRVQETLKRQVAERFAVLTAGQQQQYIDACERIDAAERGGA
jgi:choline dehydrogenase-like flavoprotein